MAFHSTVLPLKIYYEHYSSYQGRYRKIFTIGPGHHYSESNQSGNFRQYAGNESDTTFRWRPPMLHRHAYAETFYFLEGEFTVSTAETDNRLQTLQVLPGDTLTIPSKIWHNFKNVGPTPGRSLVVHNPPVMEGLLQEMGQPMEGLHQPAMPAGPLSDHQKQTMFTVLEKYMEFLPPDKVIT